MKTCKTCKHNLSFDFFNKNKKSKDGHQYSCKECSNLLNKEYIESNKIKIKSRRQKHYVENKERLNLITKEYHNNNKERLSVYYSSRIEKSREYKRQYRRNRKATDPLYSLTERIRKSILTCFSSIGKKPNTTTAILGCSFFEFKVYLESKFESWMTWENRGKYNGEFDYGWDIDHIIPVSSSITTEDVVRLNHYTNLQPLCSKINRDIKRDLL